MSSTKEEYELEKKLIELEYKLRLEVAKEAHKMKLKEINEKFDKEIQVQRFKSAAIKNTIDRRTNRNFTESYPR